jgi:glycosyltransferase involved in cell wall biosynthesis
MLYLEICVVSSSKDWEGEFKKLLSEEKISVLSNLNDQEYSKLIFQSDIYIHASVEEGFGIPLLNAAIAECAIVASQISINHEILFEESFYNFNPTSADDMIYACTRAIDDFHNGILKKPILKQFKTPSLQDFLTSVSEESTPARAVNWLGPLPPRNCGISDYSAAIVRKIPKDIQVNYYSNDLLIDDLYFKGNIRVFPISAMKNRHEYFSPGAIDVFQIAAAPWFFDYMVEMLRGNSTAIRKYCLHDHYFGYGLYNLFRNDFYYFVDTFLLPERDKKMSDLVIKAHLAYNQLILQKALQSRPILKWLKNLQGRPMTHARPPQDSLNAEIWPMPSDVPHTLRSANWKSSLVKNKKIILGCFGRITRNKYLEEVIQAIAILRLNGINAELIIVGEAVDVAYFNELQITIAKLKLTSNVLFPGNVSSQEYWKLLNTIDVLISLRDGSRGGLSAVLVNGIYAGKLIIASDILEHKSYFIEGLYLVDNKDLINEIVEVVSNIVARDTKKELSTYSADSFIERITQA